MNRVVAVLFFLMAAYIASFAFILPPSWSIIPMMFAAVATLCGATMWRGKSDGAMTAAVIVGFLILGLIALIMLVLRGLPY